MKAIVDTTILMDATLKTDPERSKALAALATYEESLLPAYAIKEFKKGPFHNWVWLHNKAVTLDTVEEVLRAIAANIPFKRYLSATALRALAEFEGSIATSMPVDLVAKYPAMNTGQIRITELRIWLRQRIMRAWRKRRNITTAVISPLSCHVEAAPVLKVNGQLDDDPRTCNVVDCCQRMRYGSRTSDLGRLEAACGNTKDESVRRRQALRRLRRHPQREYAESHCVALGDAVFALECKTGAEVLTTNLHDHEPLVTALGFTARAP